MKILTFLLIVVGFFIMNLELTHGANLAIRKSGPSNANPGDLVTYTITYSNTVSTLEGNVVITDYLPDASNCTYYSSFPSGVYDSGSNTITWSSDQIAGLGHLDAGSGENTIQVTLRMGKPGIGVNQWAEGYYLNAPTVTLNSYTEIKSDQTPTPISSNSISTIITHDCTFKISQPSAGIKSATGSTLTYLVTLTNTGNIYQKYTLNSTLFSGQHLDQSIQDLNGGVISETPFIAPGGNYLFHYVLLTPPGTTPGKNTQTTITAIPNLCGDAQSSTNSTVIYGGSYSSYELLSVYKTDSSDPVQSGDQLSYQIVISNAGSSLANVRLTETYPANTSYVSSSSSAHSVMTGNNIWDFATLPSGNTIITVTLDVANGLPNGSILSNTVDVSNNGIIYDTYTETTTVASAPDLSLTKTASIENSSAGPGSIVNYTLTYTNNGNFAASGVVIKDNYDETYMEVGNIGTGIHAGGEINWSIPGSLAPGESGTIHYSMSIKNNALLFMNGSTNIINSAIISSNLTDNNLNDNSATATVNVFVLPDLKIEKTADPVIGLVNQPITYTLSVSNIGKLDHSGSTYTVVDYLPAGTTYLSSTPSGGIYNSGSVTWTVSDNLLVNETKDFTVTVHALPCSLVGTLSNYAIVNSNLYGDADNSNNEVTLLTNVIDNIKPTIINPDPISVKNDTGKCTAEITLTAPVTDDNCGILSVTNDHASTIFPVGTTEVIWTITDLHGNVTTATQKVTVIDSSAPVADEASLPTITGECAVTVLAPKATDNCKGTIVGTTTDPVTYTDQGTYTIDWIYDDGNGNTSTQSQTIVVDDITAPVGLLASLPTLTGQHVVNATAPTATDNCKGTITGTTTDPLTYTDQGNFTILWTFNDGNGNISTQSQKIVVDDSTPPVNPTLPDVIVGECSGTPAIPTTMDETSGVLTGATTTQFPLTTQGTTIVEWTFDDGNGNIITATQNVIIDDVTPPESPVLADVIVDECSGTPAAPTATDNCSGNITGTTTTVFPITNQGLTIVEWTFDDGNGNTSTASQNVIVDDVTPPVAPVLADMTVGECSGTPAVPTTTDNCSGTITGTTTTIFPLTNQGLTIVEWTFDDGKGNTSTASQNVFVVDETAPVAPVLADVTVDECSGTPAAPTTTDNCSGTITGTTTTVFPITTQGTTVVEWTFDDGNGNKTTVTQNVIVDDVTPPVAPELADVISGDCSITLIAPTTTDNCAGVITGTTTTLFPITTKGTTVVEWTFDDGNGNKTTVTQNVMVDDNTPPVTPVLADITIGECSGTPIAPTTTDNCSGTITGTTSTIFPITKQGITVVEWTFDDGKGNVTTASQNVIVDDTTPPVTPVLADVTVGECSGTPEIPTAWDNCAGTVTGTTSTRFPINNQGTTIVTWTFDDGNGNTTTASQNVIIKDLTPPEAPTLADVALGECGGTPVTPTTTDNCHGIIMGTASTPFPITKQGLTVVEWTFDDGNGNFTTAFQNFIVDDVTSPARPVLADVTVGECSGTPVAPTTTDNCSGTVTGTTTTSFPITTQGLTIVEWTFDDGNGNVTTALQNVMVDDVTPPVVPVLADVTVGECSGTPVAPTTTDNCSGTITGIASTSFPITTQGTTVITWTFDDGHGNVSSATQNVIVNDLTPPVVTGTIATTTVEGCTAEDATPAVTTVAALETLGLSITDACSADSDLTVDHSDASNGMPPLVVTRTYTLTDPSGNASIYNQTIWITDTQDPTIACAKPLDSYPADMDKCTYTVTGTDLDPVSTSDICSVRSVINDFTHTSSLKDAIFPLGRTIVTWTVEDNSGNTSSSDYEVVVVDHQDPTIICATPAISYPSDPGVCSFTVTGTDLDPIVEDNCSVRSVINDFTHTSSLKDAIFPLGTTIVTWTVEDNNGNTTTCSYNMVVVDTQDPVITCAIPAAKYSYSTFGTELDATASDNCTIASITNDYNNSSSLAGAEFPAGTYVVTWTASDNSGNSASCSMTIVIADVQSPVIHCVSVPEEGYNTDPGSSTYNVTGTALDPTAEDNFSEVSLTNNYNNRATLNNTQFPVGETKVIWTARDGSGNTARCTQVVRVKDIEKPAIACPSDISIDADAGQCTASEVVLGMPITTDNCFVASVSNDAPKTFQSGSTIVTWTVKDPSGNTATCAQTVTVNGYPQAIDDKFAVNEDDKLSGNVMANDEGCKMTVVVKSLSEPIHGRLTISANGNFTYTPDENYYGSDAFTYQACNPKGDCSEATVYISVESVDDVPQARDDNQKIEVDLVLQGNVADNDAPSGDQGNIWSLVDSPSHGTIAFHQDGTYSYTPNTDFLGSDSFTYKVCDGDGDCTQARVSIVIEDVLSPNQILTPNADLINDTFIIEGISLYPVNKVTIYNRWGNVVYQKNNYQDEWDGSSNVSKAGAKSLPVGTYYYLIDYGKNRHKTGFVFLDR